MTRYMFTCVAEATVPDLEQTLRAGRFRLVIAAPTAEEWLVRRVRERPGHVTLATRLYASYRTWAREHDPEGPLGYTAFLNVVNRGAPIEGA